MLKFLAHFLLLTTRNFVFICKIMNILPNISTNNNETIKFTLSPAKMRLGYYLTFMFCT